MAYETLELQDPADDGGRLVLHFERPRGSFDLDPTASRADTSILVLSRLTGVSQDELRELSPRDQVAAAAVASRMIEQASEVRAAS